MTEVQTPMVVSAERSAQRSLERYQAVQYSVTRALADATTLVQAAPKVLAAMGEGFGWQVGGLWWLDEAAGVLCCAAMWHDPQTQAGDIESATWRLTFARGEGPPGIAWDKGAPCWIQDVAGDTRLKRSAVLAARGLRAALAFPIQNSREVLGAVEFFARTLDRPEPDLERLLVSLGSQIGQFVERTRFADALRESEAFYQSLVESLPQNIIRKDRQGRFTYVNQRLCDTLNLPREKIIGKTDFDLFPRDLAEKYRQDDLQVLETGAPLEAVETHQTPDGRALYVQIVKTPITDAQGQSIGTQVLFWDVTERKRWEEALSDSERRYRQLTEASQDGIIVTDAAGRITLFNPAAERMFDCAAADAVGASLHRFIPDLGEGSGAENHAPSLEGRRHDGMAFPLEVCMSRIDSGGEPSFLHTVRDLTERNRMRDILVQSEKLASIGLLSAGVAHEINNPLSYVSNNLAVLDRDVKGLMAVLDLYESGQSLVAAADPGLAERIRRAADEVDIAYVRENFGRLLGRTRAGVQRVTGIVRSLRGLARTSPPKMVQANVPELVDMSVEMIRGRMQRQGIALETDYGPVEIYCVESQLSQVLLNLIVNAIHAIEATGRSSGGLIRVATRDDGPHVMIEVADNGCGIDGDSLPKLFDPFFTTKPVGEGTGLGLSIAHGIITAHGGRIEVESQLGKGSSFRLYLPRLSDSTAR